MLLFVVANIYHHSTTNTLNIMDLNKCVILKFALCFILPDLQLRRILSPCAGVFPLGPSEWPPAISRVSHLDLLAVYVLLPVPGASFRAATASSAALAFNPCLA